MAPCLPCYVFCAMLNTTIIVRGSRIIKWKRHSKPAEATQLSCNSTQRELNSAQPNSTQAKLNSPKLSAVQSALNSLGGKLNALQANSTQLNLPARNSPRQPLLCLRRDVVVGLFFGCCSQSENGFQSAWKVPRTLTVCLDCKLCIDCS